MQCREEAFEDGDSMSCGVGDRLGASGDSGSRGAGIKFIVNQ